MVMQWLHRMLAVMVLTLFAASACLAEITVKPDRNPVSLNESFKVTFDVSSSDGDDPDFEPLQKDFQILTTSQNSYYTMINGKITTSKQWTLTLMANAPGKFEIPAIDFGSEKSPVTQIEVKDESGPGGGQDEYVFLEATAKPVDTYVQSQVVYTLKLYRSVAIAKASLGDPVIGEGNAVIKRIDEDKTYDTVLNGTTWQVIERNFAIYPQSSGTVKVPPVSFMGQISRNAYGYDPFGPPPRTVVRRSGEVVLDVKAMPASFTGGHWLPASNLTLAEQWSVDPSNLQVGQPVTRTLIMTASGLLASQLPELPGWTLPDLKFYPDQPSLEDDSSETGVTGTRSEKAAIIPNRAGTYVLPEISIPWWNTVTNKMEYAVVPERTLQVLPSAASANVPAAPAPQAQAPAPEPAVQPATADPAPVVVSDTPWKAISTALLILWLSTMYLWWHKTKSAAARSALQKSEPQVKPDAAIRQVLDACKQNDPHAVRKQLLAWARIVWPSQPPFSPDEVGRRMSEEMAAQIRYMNDALYSRDSHSWTGEALARVFAAEAPTVVPQKQVVDQGRLEPLYKL